MKTLEQVLAELVKQPVPALSPIIMYNVAGDAIEVLWDNDPHYAERIDKNLTLFRRMSDKKIIGCAIKHAKKNFRLDGVSLGTGSTGPGSVAQEDDQESKVV